MSVCPSRTRHRRSRARPLTPSGRALRQAGRSSAFRSGKKPVLDLRRGQSLRLGHDGHGRLVQIREDIDGQFRDGETAGDDQHCGNASTSSRFRSDWATRKLNIGCGFLSGSGSGARRPGSRCASGLQSGDDQNPFSIKRLHPDLARNEPLRVRMLIDDGLSVSGADHRRPRQGDSDTALIRFGDHGQQMAEAQPLRALASREMDGDRLISVRES